MDKHRKKVFSTGISVIGVENDFYTLEKMSDPYYWERIYANGVEPLMSELLPQIISNSNLLVRDGSIILNDIEKKKLAIIMIMQLLRGKQSREYQRIQYQKSIPDIRKRAKEKFGNLNTAQKEFLEKSLNDDDLFKLVSMDVVLNQNRNKVFTEFLCNYVFIFCRIQGDMEFITSDNPVMFINAMTSNAHPFSNGLLQKSTIICYPISPKLLLYAVHPESIIGISLQKDCFIVDINATVETKFISTMNRKQIEQCSQQAFAKSEALLKQYMKMFFL